MRNWACMIEHTEDLRIDLAGRKIPCRSGDQLGSLYGGPDCPGRTLDYLPRYLLETVLNIDDFARVLVLDKWTCNSDGRQANIPPQDAAKSAVCRHIYRPGILFQRWRVDFSRLSIKRRVRRQLCVQEGCGMGRVRADTHPSRANGSNEIWRLADIPEEWYEGDADGLHRLVETLYARRSIVRSLISEFRESNRNPFPNWCG